MKKGKSKVWVVLDRYSFRCPFGAK